MAPSASAGDRTAQLAALIERVALGDRAAFRTLYDRTSAKLFGVALRILKNQAQAEEVLQDVYVKIWQRADSYRPGPLSPISWLVAIARNQALDRLRARKPAPLEIDAAIAVADPSPDPEAAALAADQRAQIEDCLELLDDDKAQAVRAAYLDGHTYVDLAERFKVPLNTVRTWLRRSLIKLRDCLTA